MGNLLDTLGMAGSALLSQQTGAQVAGNNIANATTEGFSRQDIVFRPLAPNPQGVRVEGIRRSYDGFLAARIMLQAGESGYAGVRSQHLQTLEIAIGALDETGLPAHLDRFFSGWRGLTAAPEDGALRNEALARTEEMAGAIREAAENLDARQRQIDREVVQNVQHVNVLLERVAQLNNAIQAGEASGGDANALRDERDRNIEELSDLVGATAFEDDAGSKTVLIGDGISVVQGGHARTLDVQPDPVSGLHQIYVTGGARVPVNNRLTRGQLGGLLNVRDTEITSLQTELDQFAFDLATAINGVHSASFGLDGVTGRNLFAAPAAVAGAAINLSVDAAVSGTPDALGAALDPLLLPGDGRGADLLVQLEGAAVAGGGAQTLSQDILSMVTALGATTREAALEVDEQAERLGHLEALRQSQSGVSIEEQMLALNRFQRAFQAASRIVTTVDEMLQDVIALKR